MAKRNEPWFWEDGVPYDEFVLACHISNEGAVEARVVESIGHSLFSGRPTHEEIIDFVWRYARGPSKRLRSGK